MGSFVNLGISSPRFLRKVSVSISFPANPITANCFERKFSCARFRSAGISLRLVRSPVAPKITMTHGPAAVGASTWFVFIGGLPVVWAVPAWAWPSVPGFLLEVTTELKAHRGQKLVCEIRFASRRKALIQSRRQHWRGCGRLNRGENCPATLAGIRHAAGVALEFRLFEQRNGRKVEKP